jgi:diguanylate cyclase (GGDEF)-like protein
MTALLEPLVPDDAGSNRRARAAVVAADSPRRSPDASARLPAVRRARNPLRWGKPEVRFAVGAIAIAGSIVVRVDTAAPFDHPAWLLTIPFGLFGIVVAWTAAGQMTARRRLVSDRRRHESVAAVLAIAERLTRTFDRTEILRTIVTETNRVLEAGTTAIGIVRDGNLVIEAWTDESGSAARPLVSLGRNSGRYGGVLESGRIWVSDEVGREPAGAAMRTRLPEGLRFGAEMIAPLVVDGRAIGVLTVGARSRRRWTPDDIELVTAVATHASIALHNAELFARTERRAAQLDVLRAASARLSRENTVESVGRAVVEETRRIIDYHNARVYLNEEPDAVVPIAFEGTVGAYEKVDLALLRTKLGVGFTGWVAQHGEPLLVNDANRDPRGSTIPGTDEVDESMLCVPLRFDERTIGVITLSKLGLDQFSDDDQRLLMILADQAATAIETVRLLARSETLAGELRRLLDMGGELARSLDPRAVADLIARHLGGATGFDECTISYWDRPNVRLLTWGCWPADRKGAAESSYPLTPFPETRRVLEKQVVSVISVDDPTADRAEVELLESLEQKTLVMLPLVAKGESIGLVELSAIEPVSIAGRTLEVAWTMANEAAMALENAKLYEDARSLADRDPLTGFYNHRYLHDRLGEEIVRAGRSRRPLSLLMIDLDDFKLVNDTFGHLFGDRVLAWTAERIRGTLRASDVPARYGGDEFAVILPETDASAAQDVAERILEAFATAAFEDEARGLVPVGVSVGAASLAADARTPQAIIAAADAALYGVKRGRGTEVPVPA